MLRVIAVVAVLAIVPAGSSLAAAKLVKKSSGPLTATLAPPASKPAINRNIPIKITATLNGRPAHATAVYEFLFSAPSSAPRTRTARIRTGSRAASRDNLVFRRAPSGRR